MQLRRLTGAQYYQALLDKSTPYTTYRWVGTGALLLLFFLRIVLAEGWYIGEPVPTPPTFSRVPGMKCAEG